MQDYTRQQVAFEQLAEDIRLLYVALTRAVLQCFVGIWDPANKSRKSALYETAMGRLLLTEKPDNAQQALADRIGDLQQGQSIGYQPVYADSLNVTALNKSDVQQLTLANQTLSRGIFRDWQLTSYSNISRQTVSDLSSLPGHDEGESTPVTTVNNQVNRFTFTRGAQAGSFLHGVLENIAFDSPDGIEEVITQQGLWFGIDEHWFDCVKTWLLDLLKAPLVLQHDAGAEGFEHRLTLQDLVPATMRAEMEFHLPMKKVQEKDFNRILSQFSGQVQRHYGFEQINGMLKGFIDLTFCHQGRFFVADYKSNHLGDDYQSYQYDHLHSAMVHHDYHLQAILYVLALHRWLRLTLKDYQFEKHIGGACYMFMRGMSESADTGVYHFVPDKSLIMALDDLFSGKPVEPEDSEQMSLW